jgi:hypothetical protein
MTDLPPQSPPLPYASPPQVSADSEHLRLLALFHYILGGIIMLFSSCAILHVGMGIAMIVKPSLFQGPPGSPPPPAFMGYFFTAIGSAVIVAGWAFGGATIYSGRCIARRRYRIFSCVLAGVNCLSVPFGTLLGVFTLIVLCRPSVKSLYSGDAQ